MEHTIHCIPHAKQHAFCQAFYWPIQVIFISAIAAPRSKPEIGGIDKSTAPIGKELIEAPKNRVAGDTGKYQTVFFIRQSANSICGFVFHFLLKILEIFSTFFKAPKTIEDPKVNGAIGEGIE